MLFCFAMMGVELALALPLCGEVEPAGMWSQRFQEFYNEARKQIATLPSLPVGREAGKAQYFAVELKVIKVEKDRFACARFTAPAQADLDMIWSCVPPPGWERYYILYEGGEMRGFESARDAGRLYEGLPTTLKNPAKLQALTARSFTPGGQYVLWFRMNPEAAGTPKLYGAINFLPPPPEQGLWSVEMIEEGLGLKSAPVAQQVEYLNTRGVRALVDEHILWPAYGAVCVERVLMDRLWAVGSYMAKPIPRSPTQPLLAEVRQRYGRPDLVISADERMALEQKEEPELTAYYYDYVGFLVEPKPESPRIVSVTTQGRSAARILPEEDGWTWCDWPLQEMKLRMFYRDKQEIARIAFWGERKARLLSGEIPRAVFVKTSVTEKGDREELEHLGEGDWEDRSYYPTGELQEFGGFHKHVQEGTVTDYARDGRRTVEVPYVKDFIERCEWFIEKKQTRLSHQCTRQRNPHPHTA